MPRPRDPSLPACPRCLSGHVTRAGASRGVLRYFCHACNRSWGGDRRALRYHITLTCYRCGRSGAKPRGRGLLSRSSGFFGYCQHCRRNFQQGGKTDLERYHLVLEKRIADTGHPPEIKAELLQIAAADVLQGRGYCWNVPLRVTEAYRNVHGEYRPLNLPHSLTG